MTEIGEGAIKALKEVGHFRITDRSIKEYQELANFEAKNIPNGAVVVDVGSGWNQELARGLEGLDRGIKTVSLDASLGIMPERVDEVVYHYSAKEGFDEVNQEEQRKRLQEARENSVAAIMPEIPLKSESADLVVDCFGPGLYLEDKKWLKYMREVVRILKKGGEAHIYPIDSYQEFYKSIRKDTRDKYGNIESGSRRLTKLAKAMIKKRVEVQEYFQVQIDEKGEKTPRMGVIIKK